MIRAMIFDLDGTLVQTEKLKAISYARAAVELCPYTIQESEVIEAFKDVVGLSRRRVAMALVERFDLAEKTLPRMSEFGVTVPWQVYVQVRLEIYDRMLADPRVILEHQWPHNMAVLREARRSQCKVGLATMSARLQMNRVLEILELSEAFDFTASRDDVEQAKPNPEIYLLVARELNMQPQDCLVLEDSAAGVEAGLSAGMHVLAVSTPFTRRRLHDSALLPEQYIIDEPDDVPKRIAALIEKEK
jgi:HAD superfamily hydrolase (TIGR01509 family)